MTGIDWAALSRLVPEAIMVVIVLGYVRSTARTQAQRDELADAREERRDEGYRKASTERDKQFSAAMMDRDREWRDYMGLERVRQSEAIVALTRELTLLTGLVGTTHQLISAHDRWERDELDRRLPLRPKTGPLGETRTGAG